MKIFFCVTALSFLWFFPASPGKEWRHNADKEFSVSVKTIKGDTIITSAVYFNGYIICLRIDNKLFVLDTTFNYNERLTSMFSNLKIQSLYQHNDTVIVSAGNENFYLDKDLTLKKYDSEVTKYDFPYYYSDSAYTTYACSEGEWGAAIFFINKKTNKTLSYPSFDPRQILRFNKEFIVSERRGFISINDPEKLYELKDQKLKTSCNWYYQRESRKLGRIRFTTSKDHGVTVYHHPESAEALVTFPKDNILYSIYCTRSLTILARHENYKLVPVDTLLRKKLDFWETYTNLSNNISVTAYYHGMTYIEANDKMVNYQNTGLVYINNNRITFLEFQTPHMWIQ